ncbi:hypothetical protein PsAD2_00377 [Pseudovibrio axinellae]|uniref:Uncharacterized protein n=1 Tax=Pseudovibrio axinellae TaxID=989403 RepID=A0A166AZM0_9HYPH|nr:hypothetical protein PsAD2_00377 [Pseudovibrio axinellae]SEQ22038.1 hypothetical protein SAMN05421798_102169 [Pseudovibrio axinellae]
MLTEELKTLAEKVRLILPSIHREFIDADRTCVCLCFGVLALKQLVCFVFHELLLVVFYRVFLPGNRRFFSKNTL